MLCRILQETVDERIEYYRELDPHPMPKAVEEKPDEGTTSLDADFNWIGKVV